MQLSSSLLFSSLLFLNLSSGVLGFGSDGAKKFKRETRETSTAASPSPTATPPPKTSLTKQPSAKDSATPTSGSQEKTVGSSPKTTAKGTFIDPRLPPGGVVIQTPVTTSGSQYYKIGQTITIGWNYTSLIISPSAVNVEAFCSDNSQTYTIAQNVSIAKPSVIWDTGSYAPKNDQPPLAMGIYTLLIYDEKSAMTAVPAAGNLAPFNGFQFGMYTPKPYTPLADFDCPTCEISSAHSLDILAVRLLALVSFIFSVAFGLFFSLLP
ncbi:hypothetical protein TWF694_000006 [Orbilia ellipsospora]|uniref:DUF7137 domain-containing protein n=1 Tax=Orbilia ellipsospora TaxID=2528407 RepID=A0AAV9XMP4_9PEZI